jgi:hypothetical protein
VNKKQTKTNKTTGALLWRHVKLGFVPHHANQYRPHAVRRYGLVALAVVVFGLHVLYNITSTGDVLGQRANITVSGLVASTNQARVSDGLKGLTENPKLNQAAYAKAQDMLKNQYWAHESPTGIQPWKWFADADYNYNQAGENLAKGFTTNDGVTAAWLSSPSHRKNVLGAQYQDVGYAVVQGDMMGKNTTLVVALYGAPAPVGTIAGIDTRFNEASEQTNMIASIGSKIQALPPIILGSVALVSIVTFVALIAHTYRRKLPRSLQKTWYHHHGAYKALGLASFGVIIVIMYSGGQI